MLGLGRDFYSGYRSPIATKPFAKRFLGYSTLWESFSWTSFMIDNLDVCTRLGNFSLFTNCIPVMRFYVFRKVRSLFLLNVQWEQSGLARNLHAPWSLTESGLFTVQPHHLLRYWLLNGPGWHSNLREGRRVHSSRLTFPSVTGDIIPVTCTVIWPHPSWSNAVKYNV